MKKYIALILSVLILLSSAPCVFASDNLTEKYNFSHVILQGQSKEPISNKTCFLGALAILIKYS